MTFYFDSRALVSVSRKLIHIHKRDALAATNFEHGNIHLGIRSWLRMILKIILRSLSLARNQDVWEMVV